MNKALSGTHLENRWLPPTVLVVAIIIVTVIVAPSKAAVAYQSCGGGGNCDPNGEYPCLGSPIIIDVAGQGFHLTSIETGVRFDITGAGRPVQIAWTDPHFRNAFLALPGPDGVVHSGRELFGNFTSQPPSSQRNGFLALAQFDKPENGGNGDGVIDARDAVFSRLRLWIDENHDGISQPNELHTLAELGVFSVELKYRESRRIDRYGNEFRYRGRINATDQQEDSSKADPIAYDVFLVEAGQR
jgi:hypothetical protein